MTKAGKIFNTAGGRCVLREIFSAEDAGLDFLSASELQLSRTSSPNYSFPGQEVLLFNLKAPSRCYSGGKHYDLKHYDVLYIPSGQGFHVSHSGSDEALIYIYRSPGEKSYPAFHSSFDDALKNDQRIRKLNKKVVYKMFDTSEDANKFMAGYTFYEANTRAWPPHNHTDQEEVYSFIEGNGAMTVYEDEENQTFVTSVSTGDHVTIPIMNYHPVFSHESPLCFIWCIAGERYWVGDKSSSFMKGEKGKITT